MTDCDTRAIALICGGMPPPIMTDPITGARLLAPREAAEQLAVSRQTLYTWVRAGRVPLLRVGRWLRFRETDLAAVRDGTAPVSHRVTEYEPPPPSSLEPQQIADIRLLRRAIHRSGLSSRRYAREVLMRDERTVRRWLAGDSPVPSAVVELLRQRMATGKE